MDWSSVCVFFFSTSFFSSLLLTFVYFIAFLRHRSRRRHFVITSLFFFGCMVIFINTFQLFSFWLHSSLSMLKGYALGSNSSKRRHFIFAARFNRNRRRLFGMISCPRTQSHLIREQNTLALRCSNPISINSRFFACSFFNLSLVFFSNFCFGNL